MAPQPGWLQIVGAECGIESLARVLPCLGAVGRHLLLFFPDLAARLAALGIGERRLFLCVVLLLAFGEEKLGAAVGTDDVFVFHGVNCTVLVTGTNVLLDFTYG